jgi:hypothetical protein
MPQLLTGSGVPDPDDPIGSPGDHDLGHVDDTENRSDRQPSVCLFHPPDWFQDLIHVTTPLEPMPSSPIRLATVPEPRAELRPADSAPSPFEGVKPIIHSRTS